MAGWESAKRLKMLLPLIGIGIFVYIVQDIGIQDLAGALGRLNPWLFALSLSLFLPRIVISTYRWKLVADYQGLHLPLSLLIKINLIGLFYGTVTPLWVGDYVRIPYLQAECRAPLGTCTSNVIVDQLMELGGLFVLALAGSLFLIPAYPYLCVVFFAVFAGIAGAALYLKEKRRSRRVLSVVYRLLVPHRMKEPLSQEFDAFYAHLPPVRFLAVPLLIGVFSYFLYFLQIYLVALSFDLSVPPLDFLLLYPVASLIGLLPVTVSGLGTREGVLIQLFSSYGMAREVTVAISLSGYVITMLIPAVIGGLLALTGMRTALGKAGPDEPGGTEAGRKKV
ncbi:MAG: lysylphosphatidylglycerol synthase transmembrane domain-containing protein [Candidatus Thermoplasmatota archaeon]|nr:lysylphosphatidylglycerol synthase transmembrane domain-containing protein [Candidatus Thermoplasmatota archaeon]